MIRPEMEAAIRAACYRACLCGIQEIEGGNMEPFNPSLADVLAALEGLSVAVSSEGQMFYWKQTDDTGVLFDCVGGWDLARPLSGQTDATISALYGIIVKENL